MPWLASLLAAREVSQGIWVVPNNSHYSPLSVLLASYKNAVPSENRISRISVVFIFWGNAKSKLRGMNYSLLPLVSLSGCNSCSFLLLYHSVRCFSPSASVSAGLGRLSDKMTQTVNTERL